MQIRWEQLGFPSCIWRECCLDYRQKCQTLDEYSEETVRGAMGCDVLETNYNYSTIR